MKNKIYSSINITKRLKNKLNLCAQKLDVEKTVLLSVLCYKAGRFISKEAHCFRVVEYQDRGGDYEITPVCFYASDHEYMHANRLACKVSVSKLLACAMVMFLDEIMEKGIDQAEIAQLSVIQHSYKKSSYIIRNFNLDITKNSQFEEYIMKMRMEKT